MELIFLSSMKLIGLIKEKFAQLLIRKKKKKSIWKDQHPDSRISSIDI
jgi:hypothetical protein